MRLSLSSMSCDLAHPSVLILKEIWCINLPTTVNMELDAYAHQVIARLVRRYPKRPSSGIAIPNMATRTRGRRQYPSTEADRGYVKEERKCEPCEWPWSFPTKASPIRR
jgi:hypothetical protein